MRAPASRRLLPVPAAALTSQRFWQHMGYLDAPQVAAIEQDLTATLIKDFKIDLSCLLYDTTNFVNSSIDEVIHTLIEAVLIVTAVVFVFLGSWRSVLIPIMAIPLSLIGSLTFLLALGFSINLLTLLALVLAIGLVVDDAIIVVENVNRHLGEGLTPVDAALLAARELAGPIIAMTIVLIAVYVPIGFQGGLTGALFVEFAFTLAAAVTVSGIVALTLSPVSCALRSRRASMDSTRADRAATTRSMPARAASALSWSAVASRACASSCCRSRAIASSVRRCSCTRSRSIRVSAAAVRYARPTDRTSSTSRSSRQ